MSKAAENFKEYARSRGFECKSEYISQIDTITLEHIGKGCILTTTPKSFKKTKSCGICENIRSSSVAAEKFYKLLDENGYERIGTYINNTMPVEVRCPNYHITKMTPKNSYHKPYCVKCNRSIAETITELILESNNEEYEYQKSFEGLKYKDNLKVDFYLPKYKAAIEIDGEQHFNKNSKFFNEEIIKRDEIKQLYMMENNIKLYKVQYSKNERGTKDAINKLNKAINEILIDLREGVLSE